MNLIINGDDFGMTESCSEAIAQAFADGLITHTSMTANGAYFDEAVRTAFDRGFADRVGVHFNLTEGEPLTKAIAAMPEFVTDGHFRRENTAVASLSDVQREAVYEELCAQVRRLRSAGFMIAHADSHHYIHTQTAFLPAAAQVCREFGIERVRLFRDLCCPQNEEASAVNAALRGYGFRTTAHFGRLRDMTGNPVPDDTELLVHPDFDRDGVLIDRTGTMDGSPVGESLSKLLQCAGIEPIR